MICARNDWTPPRSHTRARSVAHHLKGHLFVPRGARALVVVASDGDRRLPRILERTVADELGRRGFATCQVSLLDRDEAQTPGLVRDDAGLADRLEAVVAYLHSLPELEALPVGIFGTDAAGSASLRIAAERRLPLFTAVCLASGRPSGVNLQQVESPVLLVIPGAHPALLSEGHQVFCSLQCESQLALIRGANRYFTDPETLHECSGAVADWCQRALSAEPEQAAESAELVLAGSSS